MTVRYFGLSDTDIRDLVVPLRHGHTDELEDSATVAAELFARAAWTGIAEPGDRSAGLLIAALGPIAALTALIENWQTPRIIERVDPVARAGRPALTREIDDAMARWKPRTVSSHAVHAAQAAARIGCKLAVPDDIEWPNGVDDLGVHAPLALWWRGDFGALLATQRSIALVGARAATGYGEHVAMEASAGLVDRGFAIVSGAAYGIDGMVHRAALASHGTTVAFLAGGVDRYYPSGHEALLTRIADSGAVISELPCGSAPTKWRFLQRNRLIATASQATVVLEAGRRSGSLNTAGHAAAAGRPLGAVPGPVTSPASAGCHRLLQEFDARCVTNAAEMAALVTSAHGEASLPQELPIFAEPVRSAETTRVLDALSTRSPRELNDIAARAGLAIGTVIGVLGACEIDGAVRENERGWLRRV